MTNATTTAITPVLTAEEKAKQAALTLQFARQSIGFHFGLPVEADMEKDNNIIVGKNGIFRVVRTPVATLTTQIAKMETGYTVPGLQDLVQGVELKVPKIPFKYWLMCLSFYKDVHKKDATEASVLFFWNHTGGEVCKFYEDGAPVKGLIEDGNLIVYCPVQKNQGGLSEFHEDGMVDWLRENTTPLLETHSHHTMDAYFSPTDDANENANQFYGVFGKITDAQPKFAFRFCSGKHKVNYDPWVLFEAPVVKSITQVIMGDIVVDMEQKAAFAGPWPMLQYPDDWMGQHTKKTYVTTYPTKYRGDIGQYIAGQTEWCYVKERYVPIGEGQKKTWGTQSTTPTTGGNTRSTPTGSGVAAAEVVGTNGQKKFVIETETSVVELVSPQNIVSKFTKDTIARLVTSLSDAGYDFFIYAGIVEGMYERL